MAFLLRQQCMIMMGICFNISCAYQTSHTHIGIKAPIAQSLSCEILGMPLSVLMHFPQNWPEGNYLLLLIFSSILITPLLLFEITNTDEGRAIRDNLVSNLSTRLAISLKRRILYVTIESYFRS